MKHLSKNAIMLLLAAITLVLSFITHFLHRFTGFLGDYMALSGIVEVTGAMAVLQNVFFFVPVALFVASLIVYKRDQNASILPWLIVSTLTFGSISIVAGGNGLVEYHFSIFMVIAMMAYYDSIRLIVYSTVIFAVQHLGGYFLFPVLLCGSSNYRFTLILIHAVFLLLTSGATIWLIYAKKAHAKQMEDTMASQQQALFEILHRLNDTSKSVSEYVNQLTHGAEDARHASLEIAASIQTISQGNEEQMTKMQQGTHNLHEMLREIEDIQSKTEHVNASAATTAEQAKRGTETVFTTSKQMQIISDTVQLANEKMKELEQRSTEIDNMITVISNIAEQTNLLALNASIEAARAGEHGRGFSVVAEEVRKLAQQANDSATEIQTVIQTIQQHTRDISIHMNASLQEVKKGNTHITEVQEAFQSISGSTNNMSTQFNDVFHASSVLLTNSQQLNSIMTQFAAISDRTIRDVESIVASTEQQSASSDALSDVAQSLQSLMSELEQLVGVVNESYERMSTAL